MNAQQHLLLESCDCVGSMLISNLRFLMKVSEVSEHKYGRGKFETHSNYIAYMEKIVSHENFRGMPNARTPNGRINWQVSSGVTTSFYKDYLARKQWWIQKADSLNLPGKDDENDRFTMAARLINPTGYRACRLCGEDFNVGYFYVNSNLEKKLRSRFPGVDVAKGQPIDDVITQLNQIMARDALTSFLCLTFPERREYIYKYGPVKQAFERSMHLRSAWLTPGYMGNPPDRLDGFHDYHFDCRKINDPGRSDANMRSYSHDRRSFEWWAEGNWAIADAIYNSAGQGYCSMPGCNKHLAIVSPDHVGPLACGFKQSGLFVPTCQSHNSAKNRRFTFIDTQRLIAFEQREHTSAASWQVRAHWDKYKHVVTNDNETKALSNSLRSLQDMYLRTLWELYKAGQVRLLATLLHPEYAYLSVEIVGLNAGELTFSEIKTEKKITNGRKSLAARTVRIAFEALEEYASKPFEKRKMVRADFANNIIAIRTAIQSISASSCPDDALWLNALTGNLSAEEKEKRINDLFVLHRVPESPTDTTSKLTLQKLFDDIGTKADIDFTRYVYFSETEEP